MSIINEALKKAGDNKHSHFSPAADVLTESKGVQQAVLNRKKQVINWGPVFVLMVLVLITGPLLAPIFSSPYRRSSAPLLAQGSMDNEGHERAIDNQQAQFAIEEIPRVSSAMQWSAFQDKSIPTPNFLMNGLVYSKDRSYCIINGAVVKLGDTVEGAKLVALSSEKAVLDLNGKKIELWVNS